MRNIAVFVVMIALAAPAAASGQSVELYGSAGPTVTDAGNSAAVGLGLSPAPRITLLFSFERTHLSSTTTYDGDVISSFRGGTLLLGTAEVRGVPLGRERWGPTWTAGLAIGESRPNVNETFPYPVEHRALALFGGGGLQGPITPRLTAFVDIRMMFGGEGTEGIVAVAPLRAGLAWRF